ncbi:hypothetical protein TrVE_jg2459 [Triparma verrucosa]|uniref:SEC7 domain-containing protein n=1 Tax=Triparma verrucosa TaxID=1606542 RepID=A0A9W7C262_9STRA|nr:hypothetical protein TrVE_jg2459 [Triparma verrucosa]
MCGKMHDILEDILKREGVKNEDIIALTAVLLKLLDLLTMKPQKSTVETSSDDFVNIYSTSTNALVPVPTSAPPSASTSSRGTFDRYSLLRLTVDVLQVLLSHSIWSSHHVLPLPKTTPLKQPPEPVTSDTPPISTASPPPLSLTTYITSLISLLNFPPSPPLSLSVVKFLLTSSTHPLLLLHGLHLLHSFRVIYNIFLCTDDGSVRISARAGIEQMVGCVMRRMEGGEKGGGKGEEHRDAFLVFRSLCKLSMKSVTEVGYTIEGSPNEDLGPAMESKILALELLLHVMEGAGHELLNSEKFESAIRHYLCVSLLKNCTSSSTQVVSLSLRLFVPIITHFRSLLKSEIEVFITNIFFVILQSPNSPPEHKSLVIKLFEQICGDSETLAEIFLNYDCDLSAVDLFHRIVSVLSRVGKTEIDEVNVPSGNVFGGSSRLFQLKRTTAKLRLDAMRALVVVLKSLFESIEGNLNHVNSEGLKIESKSSDESEAAPNGTNGHSNPDQPVTRSTQQSIVEIYDSKKKLKAQQVEAVLRFNHSPKTGIKYAAECGLVDDKSPQDVARYLLENSENFDKTQIGDYLGREREYQGGFCFQVLHSYCDLLDFTGLVFDDAIRHYLSGFRLPGEAQKIDRIMEKFAERFTLQNPDVFPTADVAFILAFSVIMLNTDLHNPNLKEERRMTKEGFIRNNRGISTNGSDLPSPMLEAIFDRIQKNQISLKEDDAARDKMQEEEKTKQYGMFSDQFREFDESRQAEFSKERDKMVRSTEHFFRQKRRSKNDTAFVRTSESGLKDEYVLPMFEVTWAPALSVFSIAMESANGLNKIGASTTDLEREHMEEISQASTQVCLEGLRLGTRIAGLCNLELARNTFINALLNFAALGTGKVMDSRHVRCLECLFDIALEEGEVLGNTWEHVFKIVSEVSRLKQVFERLKTDETFVSAPVPDSGTEEEDSTVELTEKAIDEFNAQRVSEIIDSAKIDKIFQLSATLSEQAVHEFVLQLCRVSRMEISGYGGGVGSDSNEVKIDNGQPRRRFGAGIGVRSRIGNQQPIIFCLQKLVEVAHYNMESRGKVIWDRLWGLMGAHFTSTALHNNAAVAMYAVDSLRQLSLKFLNREELAQYEFQRKFMRPYEEIMKKAVHSTTRELVLRCIEQIVKVCGSSSNSTLRSGWRTVIAVLGVAGGDESEEIAAGAFVTLKGLLFEVLDSAPGDPTRMDEYIVDIIRALALFAGGESRNVALSKEAIDMVVKVGEWIKEEKDGARVLGRQRRRSSGGGGGGEGGREGDSNSDVLEVWWPVLMGLSGLVADGRDEVRVCALTNLVAVLDKYFYDDAVVSEPLISLKLVFSGVLLPMFENAKGATGGVRLPEDFVSFLTAPPATPTEETGWLATSYDMCVDACVCLFNKADDTFGKGSLSEEMFSIFFHTVHSSYPSLSARTLSRMTSFILKDLQGKLTDSEWMSVGRALANCLRSSLVDNELKLESEEEVAGARGEGSSDETPPNPVVGVICAQQIGLLLRQVDTVPLSLYSDLLGALHDAVSVYEMLARSDGAGGGEGPHPAESGLYCRTIMVRVLLVLAKVNDDSDVQDMLMNITRNLISAYVEKDADGEPGEDQELAGLTAVVEELIQGYSGFSDELLLKNIWLLPLLSKLIQCSNKSVRVIVHQIVSRLFDGPLSELVSLSASAAK